MKLLNFGSVNIDRVYRVPHFVRPGETLSSHSFSCFPGGKGFNQSTALARAGANVLHAGCIGKDGVWLKELLKADGVDVHLLRERDEATGHAIIQVDDHGQNCILLDGGANRSITDEDIQNAFQGCGRGDTLLIQNEISKLSEIMRAAAERGMEIVFNPAPMGEEVHTYPLELVSLFIVNEIEASELAGIRDEDPKAVVEAMEAKYPLASVVLTLGARGAVAKMGRGGEMVFVAAEKVKAVDTTAAGDTFIGYFLAERQRGAGVEEAMKVAASAAAICVTRMGAANSIPRMGMRALE